MAVPDTHLLFAMLTLESISRRRLRAGGGHEPCRSIGRTDRRVRRGSSQPSAIASRSAPSGLRAPRILKPPCRRREWPPEQERLIILANSSFSKAGTRPTKAVRRTIFRSARHGSDTQKRWYLIDVWRKRVDYPELKKAAQSQAAKHKAKRILVEDAGTGTSLVQELRSGKVPGIVALKSERDKVRVGGGLPS
jgi:hypothetical protein